MDIPFEEVDVFMTVHLMLMTRITRCMFNCQSNMWGCFHDSTFNVDDPYHKMYVQLSVKYVGHVSCKGNSFLLLQLQWYAIQAKRRNVQNV